MRPLVASGAVSCPRESAYLVTNSGRVRWNAVLGQVEMSDRNGLCPIGYSFSGGKLMDSMQYIRAVVSIPTLVADADGYVF